jgi:hypothetical protein
MAENTPVVPVNVIVAPMAPEDGGNVTIGIGFHNAMFSQVVYVPYSGMAYAEKLGNELRNAIVNSAREIEKRIAETAADNKAEINRLLDTARAKQDRP